MKNYFIYLPNRKSQDPWECVATSLGYSKIPPHHIYPPVRHPVDHHFTWANGRVLRAYQIIYISEGRGVFESEGISRRWRVGAGSVLILFPGIWHRYAPDQKTGWAEHWIECSGECFDRARGSGQIASDRPVLRIGFFPDLLLCFDRCHALAQRLSVGSQALLSTMGIHILSLVLDAARLRRGSHARENDFVLSAQRLILESYQERIRMQEVATTLHVGYSRFRQAFKSRTGLSPKQYQLQARIQKAQDLLLNTPMSVKEISLVLGFDSPYHLSRQFKHQVGLAPRYWRQDRKPVRR
jgi:AraC-like DNA-binding protein